MVLQQFIVFTHILKILRVIPGLSSIIVANLCMSSIILLSNTGNSSVTWLKTSSLSVLPFFHIYYCSCVCYHFRGSGKLVLHMGVLYSPVYNTVSYLS